MSKMFIVIASTLIIKFNEIHIFATNLLVELNPSYILMDNTYYNSDETSESIT